MVVPPEVKVTEYFNPLAINSSSPDSILPLFVQI